MSDFGVLDQQHSNDEDGYESFYWVDEPYNSRLKNLEF